MNTIRHFLLLPILFIMVFSGCKKNNNPPLTELEKLPPITQTGANTFGCLLNGKAYMPGGGGIFGTVLSAYYDPTYGGGELSIRAKRIIDANNFESLAFNCTPIRGTGNFPLIYHSVFILGYTNTINSCSFNTTDPPPPLFIDGNLSVTKFDTVNRIVSGIFSFKVTTSNCGTIEATDGRFDVKY